MNIVGIKTRAPHHNLEQKSIPGLSNNNVVNNNEPENVGIAQSKNLLSFLKNGNAIKNTANGNKKN